MRYRLLTAFTGLLVIACLAPSVFSQSGRRQSKPAPAAPVPTPTPEPTPVPKKEEKEPELIFLVGADRQSSYGMPFVFYDAALRGCADRLRQKSSASVDVSERDVTRGEAIKKAKAESKTYVILLGLRYDAVSRSYDDIQLDFVVFAPMTAKVVITGRSYLNANRAGPVIIGPTSRGGALYREQLLKQAGEDAADRILKKINLGTVTN